MSIELGQPCIIDISPGPGFVRVTFCGEADMAAAEAVRSALADAHGRALSLRSGEVILDLSRLEFMNSTCLKTFLTWLGRLEGLTPHTRYRVRMISNPSTPWQRRSLHALVAFAPDLVTIDTS